MIPVQQLGWMAGVIDLKGRIVYKNNKARKSRQIVLMVECKEPAIIRSLARLTGTQPEMQEAKPLKDFMRRGCSEHCPEAHVDIAHEHLMMPWMGRWTITGAGMVVVLYNIMPFLYVDRDYEAAIEEVMNNTVFTGQGATAVLRSLARLRSLGWELPELYEAALDANLPQQEKGEEDLEHDTAPVAVMA